MTIRTLHQKIEDKTARIGVIGLGYVGLPAACMFADAGFAVTGVDVKPDRVDLINQGQSPIEGDEPGLAELLTKVVEMGKFRATADYDALREADIVLIVVETPVDDTDHKPRYAALQSACRSLGAVLKDDALVICESTVAPGTVDGLIGPTLEEVSGKKANTDFYLGACPERVMPGKLLANLRGVSRVCGGSTSETARAMVSLYSHIVEADLDAADVITAELVKTTENAYRDVQIGFANEVAMICEANGANVWHVRELVNKSPFRNMHLPGAGVGGHCIPKDPWLLAFAAPDDVDLRIIPSARAVNDGMPLHILKLAEKALASHDHSLVDARLAVLGYAYLEESDDTRNSPSAILVEQLEKLGIDHMIHDPWVDAYKGDLFERIGGCDAAIIMVKHAAYRDMDLESLKDSLRTPILIDGRGLLDPEQVQAAGLTYYGIGRGDI
ncbi:MAG: nucleotide sugar dehydrogenase [Anaerolineae bacterium]|nr:nucleotide sugar dehydrogenase [Anaerolineae bacterium]